MIKLGLDWDPDMKNYIQKTSVRPTYYKKLQYSLTERKYNIYNLVKTIQSNTSAQVQNLLYSNIAVVIFVPSLLLGSRRAKQLILYHLYITVVIIACSILLLLWFRVDKLRTGESGRSGGVDHGHLFCSPLFRSLLSVPYKPMLSAIFFCSQLNRVTGSFQRALC